LESNMKIEISLQPSSAPNPGVASDGSAAFGQLNRPIRGHAAPCLSLSRLPAHLDTIHALRVFPARSKA
jgi:hypothetical protein